MEADAGPLLPLRRIVKAVCPHKAPNVRRGSSSLATQTRRKKLTACHFGLFRGCGRFVAHRIGVFVRGEDTGADVSRIGLHRSLDRISHLRVFLDKFRNPGAQAEHVLEHEDLAVAFRGGSNADGRDRDLLGDTRRKQLGERLEHDGKGTGLGDRARILLEGRPFGAEATRGLKLPIMFTACGVMPIWLITGMPRSVR